MIRINLLPVRQMKQKAQAKMQLFAGAVALIAVLVLLSIGAGYLGIKVSNLENKIAHLETRKKELQKTLDIIKELEKKKALVEKQIDIVHELENKSILTVRIIDAVARITPHERMWLTSLDQGAGTLKLNGMALDNRTIAKYLEDLKDSPYITNVTLASSSLTKYAGRNLKSFVLSCSVALPAPPEEAKAETTN
ncbi:MAG: pilus assembly protein PilN [Candidatus Electrothrix sp. AR4]|nr:pilus assembly protein PilN [Candidatus Electrothrix sp. AR4]